MTRISRTLISLLVCASLLYAPPARGMTLLDSQVTNVSSTPLSIMTATAVYVQIRSAAGSVAVVTIETSLDQLAWTTAATITNPTSTGEQWSGPGGGFLRVTIGGWVSGSITVKSNAVRGADILF